jgi:hypothetical protein
MMENADPTIEEWKELYRRATMFKELAPWLWMDDGDLFGVEDPESGEIGYCCVIGTLGEVLGLIVYRGDEGFSVYEGLLSGTIDPDDDDLHALQNCISVTFEDREMLDKKDLGIIKTLGLKFRGRQEWPMFRSHVPGFVPWPLTGKEARFMSLALRQAMGMAERLREDPDLLYAEEEDRYMVLYAENGGERWREEWITTSPYRKEKAAITLDDLRLARIKAASRKVDDSWEVDFFFASFVVAEGERPFFPYVALYAAHKEGLVINFSMAPRAVSDREFQSSFLALLEKTKVLPKAIIVRKDTVMEFFQPFAERLGFTVKKAKNLTSLDRVKQSLMSYMNG